MVEIINEICLKNLATYTDFVIMKPSEINFCYGSNGSGKTTLSNFIGGYINPDECALKWSCVETLQVLAYNKKFVEANFGENPQIAGIFTLGEESTEGREFIEKQEKEIEKCNILLETYSNSIRELTEEKGKGWAQLEKTCWAVQQLYGEKFKEALIGYRGSRKAFAEKCLEEFTKVNHDNPPLFQDIEKLYFAAYSQSNQEYPYYDLVDIDSSRNKEQFSLLEERISGSNDSPLGTFIEFLQNSDWVKEGIGYAKLSKGKCPYCQQLLPEDIKSQLELFFDETYEQKVGAILHFSKIYKDITVKILETVSNILGNPISFLEYDELASKYELLKSNVIRNQEKINDKIESPSTFCQIESLVPLLSEINEIIGQFNSAIRRNNEIFRNQLEERKNCQEQIWKCFTYELRETIKQYNKESKGKEAGIMTLQGKHDKQKEFVAIYKKLIKEKEETLTSVLPTVKAINKILKRFGFDGFIIAENTELKGTYKIIRPDGADANKTLSEGEYNFITFLYFYQLVYGSHYKVGLNGDKVVLVDDPVSSLDSNVLFMISTLVRQMLYDCENNKYGIKQVFVLTHNVYFHKEVTYIGRGKGFTGKHATYWIIKKLNGKSEIINYEKNPIKTSYELLWADLKEQGCQSRVTIFNTLRRILEYYFNVIGGLNYEECLHFFEGEDKIACKALISCINDGSHFISDDFVTCFESDSIENYLRVFKSVFKEMGHESHYNMMMGIK